MVVRFAGVIVVSVAFTPPSEVDFTIEPLWGDVSSIHLPLML